MQRSLLFCLLGLFAVAGGLADAPVQACMCRHPVSTVISNMHTLQTMLEAYGVDWGGVYPQNLKSLQIEAQFTAQHRYWQKLINPYGYRSGWHIQPALLDMQVFKRLNFKNERTATILGLPIDFSQNKEQVLQGVVLYQPIFTGSVSTSYAIYGLDGVGQLILHQGQPFVLSNS